MRDFVLSTMLRSNGIVIISWMLTLYTKCVQLEMDNPLLNLHLKTSVCCPKKQMAAYTVVQVTVILNIQAFSKCFQYCCFQGDIDSTLNFLFLQIFHQLSHIAHRTSVISMTLMFFTFPNMAKFMQDFVFFPLSCERLGFC